MGVATLGFAKGPKVTFRIDPTDINWNFKINTNVQNTMGGRVVQVIGATLSDLVIVGQFGEQRGRVHYESWVLAKGFYDKIRQMMAYQSRNADGSGEMGEPAIFSYPPLKIRFSVYIKAIEDPDGGNGITHRPGKFSYGYILTLFIVQEGSGDLVIAGTDSSGILNRKRQKAIDAYMRRIANGIGWKYSDKFNGPSLNTGVGDSVQAVASGPNNTPVQYGRPVSP
jgi:hypothetical protein